MATQTQTPHVEGVRGGTGPRLGKGWAGLAGTRRLDFVLEAALVALQHGDSEAHIRHYIADYLHDVGVRHD